MSGGYVSPFRTALEKSEYRSATHFAEAAGLMPQRVLDWCDGYGKIPRDDMLAYKVAGLLHVAPTDLWPEWEPSDNFFARKIREAGYESVSDFARVTRYGAAVDKWVHNGNIPREDHTVLHVAKLLHVEPNELWPDWQPRTKRSKLQHGIIPQTSATPRNAAEIREKACVWVGRRFVMHYPTKDNYVTKPCTVVECAPYWFRVEYDAGGCECFHYQCRIDKTESKYFRTPKARKEA